MKRLSYVAECASRPHPPPLTPSLALGSGHTRQRPTPSLRTVAPSRVATPAERAPVKTGEKCAPSHREGGKRSNASSTVGYSRNKLEPSQMRRYILYYVLLSQMRRYILYYVLLSQMRRYYIKLCVSLIVVFLPFQLTSRSHIPNTKINVRQ